jgi:hypothetical protein
MQIPRSYIENYSNSLNQISATARESLSKALMQLNYDADIADIRNAVIAVMQTACGASSDLSARLAAEFYDGLRLQFGIDDGYQAEVDSGRVPEATDGAVRAFVQDLVDDRPIEQFVGKCVDRLDYETRKAANECIATNAKNDPEKPRWARVPTGVETCQFCIMLASRGFVYHSEETASHAHAHCDCRVVPSWDKSPLVQGYDPDKYYDMWKHPEKYENAQPGVSTVQIVGVSKGEPMNFDDADGMKANPGYESDFARVMNCQTCVVANEARRRGYDVQAQPYSKQNEAMFALAERPTRAYINPETGKEPEMIRVEESPTKARFNKLCEETVKDGERYHLRIETKAGGGHVVCMDRDENGVLRVYDPQDGSIYKASEYLKRAKYSSKSYGITVPEDNYIFRVDNAEFNTELINDALEPAK